MQTMEGRVSHLQDTVTALQGTVNYLAQNCFALCEGLLEDDDHIELLETMLLVGKSVEVARSQVRRVSKAVGSVAIDVFS